MKRKIIRQFICAVFLFFHIRALGQSHQCPTVSGKFYYVELDIRTKSTYPVIMAGISSKLCTDSLITDSIESFISSFYEQFYYVSDPYFSYKPILISCLGAKDSVDTFINNHKAMVASIINKWGKQGKQIIIKLKTGEQVNLRIIKISGEFWVLDKNKITGLNNSNEININQIPEIKDCYIPFMIDNVYRTK